MSSSRWDPWGDIISLREAMNNLLEESFVSRGQGGGQGPRAGGPSSPPQAPAATLAVDVRELGDAYEVTASVPGVSPDQVEITVLGDRLRIHGERREDAERSSEQGRWIIRERRYGAFDRSITLPTQVKPDAATAEFKDGVLTITLPKADEARPRTIPVRPGTPGVAAPQGPGELEGQTSQGGRVITPGGGQTSASGS